LFKNTNSQVRAGWLILLVVIAIFIAQGIFTELGAVILLALQVPGADVIFEAEPFTAFDEYPWNSLIIYGGAEAGTIVAIILIWRFVNKGKLQQLGFLWSLKDAFFGLLLGALSITLIFLILLATGLVELKDGFTSPAFSTYTLITCLFFILVGIAEEVFFRGYIMSTMQARDNSKWVIFIVSAIIFSLMHGMNPNVNALGLINITLIGLLFAYMFNVTKSLWLPIGYHITWNYFQGSVFGFAVSGTESMGIYESVISSGNAFVTGGDFGLEGGVLTTFMLIFGYVATKVYVKWGTRTKEISS